MNTCFHNAAFDSACDTSKVTLMKYAFMGAYMFECVRRALATEAFREWPTCRAASITAAKSFCFLFENNLRVAVVSVAPARCGRTCEWHFWMWLRSTVKTVLACGGAPSS